MHCENWRRNKMAITKQELEEELKFKEEMALRWEKAAEVIREKLALLQAKEQQ